MTLQNALNLGKIYQDLFTGKPIINSDTNLYGQLSIFPKLEVKTSFNGAFFYPWNETSKWSGRIDLWSEDATKEYEFSFFRDTYCTNAKVGLAIYKPDQTNTINSYFSATGTSYVCVASGWFGVGTASPADRLDVQNGNIRTNQGLKLGTNANRIVYASTAPTSGSWGRGDIVFNMAPSASGFVGWVCTAGGTPGTWKSWGAISA
jgi:hypothetical protein